MRTLLCTHKGPGPLKCLLFTVIRINFIRKIFVLEIFLYICHIYITLLVNNFHVQFFFVVLHKMKFFTNGIFATLYTAMQMHCG